MKRAVTMEEGAFAALVKSCQGTLYAAAMAILRNHQDAMDAVQEGILKGWKCQSTLRDETFFSTWLTRIVIRCAIDITRRRKPAKPIITDIPSSDPGRDMRIDVRRAIESLDEKTRLCAVLYYFEDMTVEGVAAALGIRVGTVKSRLFRARVALRDALEGYEYEK